MGFVKENRSKFRKGEPIKSVDELQEWMASGGYCYLFGGRRACHPAFVTNQQFGSIINQIKYGGLIRAVRIEK